MMTADLSLVLEKDITNSLPFLDGTFREPGLLL